MGRGRTPVTRAQQNHLRRDRENLVEYRRRLVKEENERRAKIYTSDVPTRCSECPPAGSCETCAGINMARITTGLLKPKEDPTPHPNNCMLVINEGPYRGGFTRKPQERFGKAAAIVAVRLKRSGNGWMRGVASLNGKDVWVQPKATRNEDEAWDFATEKAEYIRIGLDYEQ
jgi:hypothetical protein